MGKAAIISVKLKAELKEVLGFSVQKPLVKVTAVSVGRWVAADSAGRVAGWPIKTAHRYCPCCCRTSAGGLDAAKLHVMV